MGVEKRWPGGAFERADRAGMEVQAAFRLELHPSQRRMQATRLANRHGLSRQRALLIAAFAFGECK